MERLNDVQLTYPPSAAVAILASPSTLRSRSILASVRVAISMPVVLSKKFMTVTNMTASRSPASAGNAVQEKPRRAPGCHGEMSPAIGCGRNIQPSACATTSGEPVKTRNRYVAAIAASSTPGRTKGLFERRSARNNVIATISPAASLAAIAASRNAPILVSAGR